MPLDFSKLCDGPSPEEKKKEMIRQEIRDLTERGDVTREEFSALRMNSWEQEHLYPHLTDEALAETIRYFVKNSRPKGGPGPCSTYDEALTHVLAPLAAARLDQ